MRVMRLLSGRKVLLYQEVKNNEYLLQERFIQTQDTVLLDDCLSAVDSHTAKWIFDNCIRGPLMRNRTCILVTHNLALCVPQSRYIVCLDNGRVDIQGSSEEVIASGKLGEEVSKSRPGSASISRIPSRVPSSVGEDSGETLIEDTMSPGGDGELAQKLSKVKSADNGERKDAMAETKSEGGVKWDVLMLYLTSMGPWYVLFRLSLSFPNKLTSVGGFGLLQFGVWRPANWQTGCQYLDQTMGKSIRNRVFQCPSDSISG